MTAAAETSTQRTDWTELLGNRLASVLAHGDILLAVGVIAILVVLILPLPSWLLDVGLAFSIMTSVLVLLTALSVERPLDFNAFPTVLLLATMIRLSLNLASTRLILTNGHRGGDAAGDVIEAFGDFVMGGNFVIGLIVFLILVLVNFIVITKGSGRIAEVSARFTLDAMPGKQMAIDADLSAGLIDEAEARRRRKLLEDESSFYGAMDGAGKFVRGDAVAGLLITLINILGGMIVGVGQQGMGFLAAAETFTRLTVGDGLVTQIPALIVSTAAGIIVTKASVAGATEKALLTQLGGKPKVLGVSAVLLAALAILPGTPALPFLGFSLLIGGSAWWVSRRQGGAETAVAAAAAPPLPEEVPISSLLKIDDIRLELGYGLLSLVGGADDRPKLTDQIKGLRRQLALELGFVMPSVRIQDNMQLGADTYVLRIKEIEAGRGEVRAGQLLIIDPRGEALSLPGEPTREPTFGLPATWIDPGQREEALLRGYTVVEPATVITTHLTELVKQNLPELLTHAETRKLLDEVGKDHRKLIDELIPGQISFGGVQRVLQNLLAERISIRDLPTILEAIAEATTHARSITLITEHVRARLARQISDAHTNEQGVIPLLALGADWEHAFTESLQGSGEDRQLALPPSKLQEFIVQVRSAFDRHAQAGESPVLLTSAAVRPYVRSIVDRFRPMTVVMSQNEISPRARIRTLGHL